jgi:hypothetical protein
MNAIDNNKHRLFQLDNIITNRNIVTEMPGAIVETGKTKAQCAATTGTNK